MKNSLSVEEVSLLSDEELARSVSGLKLRKKQLIDEVWDIDSELLTFSEEMRKRKKDLRFG